MSQISQYLVEALNAELSCRIKHERQVAYILLLIRKLLETERYKRQDASFWILSDWVVHSRMDRNQWIDELTDVAHKMIDLSQVTYDKLGVREQYFVTHVFSLFDFRERFIKLLERHGVKPIVIYEVEQWHAFLLHLGTLVYHTPLTFRDSPCLDSVRMRILGITDQPEAKKLRIEWLFKRRDGRDDYTYSSTLHFVAGNQDMFAGQRELRDP